MNVIILVYVYGDACKAHFRKTPVGGAPSEVLWGLAIINTCGVPFLTFTWLLAMHLTRYMFLAEARIGKEP